MAIGLSIIEISEFKKFRAVEHTRIRRNDYAKMFDVLNRKYESLRNGLIALLAVKHQLSKKQFTKLYNQHIKRLKYYEFVMSDLEQSYKLKPLP